MHNAASQNSFNTAPPTPEAITAATRRLSAAWLALTEEVARSIVAAQKGTHGRA